MIILERLIASSGTVPAYKSFNRSLCFAVALMYSYNSWQKCSCHEMLLHLANDTPKAF